MGLADYNGQGRSDIPVGKNNNRTNANNSSSEKTYTYLELIRQANARAEEEKLHSQQPRQMPQQSQGNIPIQRQRQQNQGNIPVQRQTQQNYGGQIPVQRSPQQNYGTQRQQQVRPQQSQPVYVAQRGNQYQQPQPQPQQRQQSVNFRDLRDEFDNRQYNQRQNPSQSSEYSNSTDWEKPRRKRRKRRRRILKTIIALFMIMIIAFGGITAYLYSVFTNVNYKDTSDQTSMEAISNMLSKDYVYNILLIGVDDRKGGETSRSDTMILLSIDKQNKQLKMLSFMRDTYVEIPGHGKAKMNAACTYGGPELVMETIEVNFGINVDNYMLVDFNAFKDIIDNLGGVTVEVEQREAEYINKTSRQKIDYGKNVELNGEEALVYVRIRYLDSDFYRTQRQRKVISAIIESAKQTNPVELIKTVEGIMPYIETDMSPLQLTVLAESAVFYIGYDVVQGRVPFDGAYSNKTINGQAVLYIDLEKTKKLVNEFVYEKVKEEKTTKK